MAKKRKAARKAKRKVDTRSIKRKRDDAEKLNLPHGVISGAYANVVEQFHPDGYDEEKIAKREGKRKTKRKAKSKVARKAKAKKKAAPKRKVKTRRKK
jgi:hypothetical protein